MYSPGSAGLKRVTEYSAAQEEHDCLQGGILSARHRDGVKLRSGQDQSSARGSNGNRTVNVAP